MTNKNKVTVKIMDRDYPLVSEDSSEHVQMLANYVDDVMRSTQGSNKQLSISMVAVLSSLNIAENYFKVLGEKEYLEKRLNSPQFELKDARDELQAVVSEFERRSQAYENMIDEFTKLIDSSSIYETGVTQLKKKMERLEIQLRLKEEELEKSKQEMARMEELNSKKETQLTMAE